MMDIATKNNLEKELVKHFPKISFRVYIENNRVTIIHNNDDGLEFSDNVASVASEYIGGDKQQCIDILIDPS